MTESSSMAPMIDELQASGSKRCSLRYLGRDRPFYGDREEEPERRRKKLKKAQKRVKAVRISVAPAALMPSPADASIVTFVGAENGEEIAAETIVDEDDASASGSGKSAHMRVKETLRAFNSHFLYFVQEEERRCQQVGALLGEAPRTLKIKLKGTNNQTPENALEDSRLEDSKVVSGVIGAKGVSKHLVTGVEEEAKRVAKRPDLKTISKMLETKTVLYPEKRIGHIPGIDVGQQFFSRAEMVVVGLHSHWLNGIDFMGVSYGKMEKYKDKKFPLAVCIVLSGIYEDSDNLEDLTYTGQGGHDLNNKKQVGDQKMKSGNLALKDRRTGQVHGAGRRHGSLYLLEFLHLAPSAGDPGVSWLADRADEHEGGWDVMEGDMGAFGLQESLGHKNIFGGLLGDPESNKRKNIPGGLPESGRNLCENQGRFERMGGFSGEEVTVVSSNLWLHLFGVSPGYLTLFFF